MTWTELYPGVADELAQGVRSGPVVLTGLPGSGRAELVRELLQGSGLVEVDALNAATAGGLRQDAIRAVIRAVAGDGPRSDFNLAVADTFGGRASEALAVADGAEGISWPMADIFGALPHETTLLVLDAHLFSESWAARALWALRARMQRPDRPGLVLLTRPWHTELLVGMDAPFFGFASLLGLPLPSAADWAAATEYRIPPAELDWLLKQTRGLPSTTLAVLERLPRNEVDLRGHSELETAWRDHVRGAREAAVAVRRLVRGLHQLAPRLLRAIASGARVYKSVPDARTDAIAAALRAMRDHDVIYQPRARQWAIADPALVPHLASDPF